MGWWRDTRSPVHPCWVLNAPLPRTSFVILGKLLDFSDLIMTCTLMGVQLGPRWVLFFLCFFCTFYRTRYSVIDSNRLGNTFKGNKYLWWWFATCPTHHSLPYMARWQGMAKTLDQGPENFFCNEPDYNLGSAGQTASVTTTQFCHGSMKQPQKYGKE